MKREPDGLIREKQRKIRDCCWMIGFKCLIPALPFLFLLVFFAIMWGVNCSMAPDRWLTDEVRFARMGEVEYLSGGRFGGRDDGPALMTTDGRAFTCSVEEAALLAEKLRGGEMCSIWYCHGVSGYKKLEALTVNGEVLIDPMDSEQKWQDAQRELAMMTLGDLGAAVIAAAVSYLFWGRKEWDNIHRLQEEIAVRRERNAARAARRKERSA